MYHFSGGGRRTRKGDLRVTRVGDFFISDINQRTVGGL